MTAAVCTVCRVAVERDDTASAWLKRPVWFDPNVVDLDSPGTHCEDSPTTEHVVQA